MSGRNGSATYRHNDDDDKKTTRSAHLNLLKQLGLHGKCVEILYQQNVISLDRVSKNTSALDEVDLKMCRRLKNEMLDIQPKNRASFEAPLLLVTFLESVRTRPSVLVTPGQGGRQRALSIEPSIDRLDAWVALRGRVPSFDTENDLLVYIDHRYSAVSGEQFLALNRRVRETVGARLRNASLWMRDQRKHHHQWPPKFGELHHPIFVQKVVIERPDESRVALIGDLHSSLDSLLNILHRLTLNNWFSDNFTLARDRYIVFLGDVVDRGPYSIELLALVMQLLIANPDRVFFINGNHEDCETYRRYGLMEEVRNQFVQSSISMSEDDSISNSGDDASISEEDAEERDVLRYTGVLHFLPSAIVLQFGSKVYQLCHGAMTEHRDERAKIKSLIEDKNGAKFVFLRHWLNGDVCEPKSDVKPDNLKWGDFDGKVKGLASSERDGHRGGMKVFGWSAVQKYLESLRLTAIISGHQDFSNFTMLIAPDDAQDKHLNVLIEPDENYDSLHRPKNYAALDIDAQYVLFEPGVDFLACNTSSSLDTKGNDGLRYDCFLTLFVPRALEKPRI